jgi:hypothetical protein
MTAEEEATLRRDLEKMVITADNLLRALQGEIKFSDVSEHIARTTIDRLRRHYGFSAKTWITKPRRQSPLKSAPVVLTK